MKINKLKITNPYNKVEILTNKDLEDLLDRFPDIGVPTGDIREESDSFDGFGFSYHYVPEFKTYNFDDQKIYLREVYAKLSEIQVKAAQAADLGKEEAVNLIDLGMTYKTRFMDALGKLAKDHKEAVALMQKAEDDKVLENVKANIEELSEKKEAEYKAKNAKWLKEQRMEDFKDNMKAIIIIGLLVATALLPLWLNLGGVI